MAPGFGVLSGEPDISHLEVPTASAVLVSQLGSMAHDLLIFLAEGNRLSRTTGGPDSSTPSQKRWR